MRIASGVTDQYVYFLATLAGAPITGLSTWTVYRSRNGAAAAAMTTPTINETDATNMPGVYELLLDEDMTIGSGNKSEAMAFNISEAGMDDVVKEIELYEPDVVLAAAQPNTIVWAAKMTYDNGIVVNQAGAGHGLEINGGSSSGAGLRLVGGAPDGHGFSALADGAGHGMYAQADLTGQGFEAVGGSTSGAGFFAQAIGGNSAGIAGIGSGSSAGLAGQGGATGAGIEGMGGSTSGAGLKVSFTSGFAIDYAGTEFMAAVNTEADTAVNEGLDTAITELGVAAPTATPTVRTALMLLYMALRNKRDTTSTTDEIHNDAGTVIASATLSDDAVTYTKTEYS